MGEINQTRSTPARVPTAIWLEHSTTESLHDEVWPDVNMRYHGLVMAARGYANRRFADLPEEKAAFFEGLTVALGALAHDEDIKYLEEKLNTSEPSTLDA